MRIGDGLGQRLAEYRGQRRVSAQGLADLSGGAISRFTIAAIESGRRKSPSTDEVALLAALLGVPPVALLLPLDRPYTRVEVAPDWSPTVAETAAWLTGLPVPTFSDGYVGSVAPAPVAPNAIPYWLHEYERAVADIGGITMLGAQGVMWTGDGDAPTLEDARARMGRARAALLAMGVNLKREDAPGVVVQEQPRVAEPD